jgi:hypothetical protein
MAWCLPISPENRLRLILQELLAEKYHGAALVSRTFLDRCTADRLGSADVAALFRAVPPEVLNEQPRWSKKQQKVILLK